MNLLEIIDKSRNIICFLCNIEMEDGSNHCDLFYYSCKCGIDIEIKEDLDTKNLEHISIRYWDITDTLKLTRSAEITIVNNIDYQIVGMFTGNINNNKKLDQFISYINKIQVFK